MLSIITTCKNRRIHLEKTLSLMCSQSFSEVVVVDYGCEHGTATWVSENFPKAKIIRVDDDPHFCLARARNIGAAHASNEFLLFIDADTILNVDLGKWLKNNLRPRQFYISKDRDVLLDLWGFLVCDKISFNTIGGYDEAFREWGGEDADIYERLKGLGLKMLPVPSNSLTPIEHSDELRQLSSNSLINFETRNQMAAFNQCYRLIKTDIQNIAKRQIDLEMRKEIRQTIFSERLKALSMGKKHVNISIDVPSEFRHVQRTLTYKISVS